MVIENWVKLEPGVPKTLHFVDHKILTRVITDPIFKRPKRVQSIVFLVDREDGMPVEKSFSVVSERLANELKAYLEGKRYVRYEFTFIKDAPGPVAPRILRVTPLRTV